MMKSDISLRFTDKRQGIIMDHPCAHMHLTDFSLLECREFFISTTFYTHTKVVLTAQLTQMLEDVKDDVK